MYEWKGVKGPCPSLCRALLFLFMGPRGFPEVSLDPGEDTPEVVVGTGGSFGGEVKD